MEMYEWFIFRFVVVGKFALCSSSRYGLSDGMTLQLILQVVMSVLVVIINY